MHSTGKRVDMLPRWLGGSVVAITCAVLASWAHDGGILLVVIPGRAAMQPATACCLGFLGLALASAPGLARGLQPIRTIMAGLAAAWATLTLVQYATGADLGIDHRLFPRAVNSQPSTYPYPGRMSVVTALEVLLSSVALPLTWQPPVRRRVRLAGARLATIVLLIAAVAVLGHIFAVLKLNSFGSYGSVAIHTALALMAIAIGALALARDVGWVRRLTGNGAGATAARILLPVVVIGPAALGWILVQGSRAGLYDTEFRVALFALGNTLLLGALVLWAARRIDRVDMQRRIGETMFRRALEDAPFPAMVHAEDGHVVMLNNEWLTNTGYQREQITTVTDWIDRAYVEPTAVAVRAKFQRLYSLDKQIDEGEEVLRAADGTPRLWAFRASPLGRDSSGRRLVLSMAVDLTVTKEADERQRLLMREVDHRAKNALAVVQAILRLTKADNPADFAAAVEGRVDAMAHAHTLLADNKWAGVEMAALVRAELALDKAGAERIAFHGPAVTVRAEATQALALVLHELAANAARHGALSTPQGRVDVAWSVTNGGKDRGREGRQLQVLWREQGGAAVDGPPACRGFGMILIRQTICHQLAGRVQMGWEREGLLCTLMLPETCFVMNEVMMQATPPETSHMSSSPTHPVRRPRILLVEDEPLVAMVAEMTLIDAGYDVLGPVGRVQDALDLLQFEQPDAAVLDVNLFGQPVYPVAERLVDMSVPFVFCTGYTQLEVRSERLRHVLVLHKPLSGSHLVQSVADLVASGRSSVDSGSDRAGSERII